MFPRLRESLALILIALLPFHALLVTIVTKLIAGPGHAPLGMLAVWKELMLGLIVLCAFIEIIRSWDTASQLRGKQLMTIDGIDICILLGIIYAITSLIAHSSQLTAFLLGFKYDFLPLVAFFILRRVSWSVWFQETVIRVLLIVGAIVALYGIATFFLPMSFFIALGYSDLHSLYLADAPLAAFQQIGGSTLRRIQSTMSGPNQLGVWLLIPLGVIISSVYTKKVFSIQYRVLSISLLIVALVMTMSRAAWIGALVMVAVAFWQKVQSKKVLVFAFACVLVVVAVGIAVAPQVLIRRESLIGHIEKPLTAIHTIIAHPFGLGLGTAGPASNRTSDTCIDQPVGSDISWANDRPDLCVFVGGTQVQPTNRTCTCPLLTENWYLQWGVEMGVFGLVLSLMFVFLVLRKLIMENGQLTILSLIFLAVSVASLFLHAWEDAAVALTVWVMVGVCMDVFRGK